MKLNRYAVSTPGSEPVVVRAMSEDHARAICLHSTGNAVIVTVENLGPYVPEDVIASEPMPASLVIAAVGKG